MALNFPSTPNTNDIYTYSGNSWIWNGYAWDSLVTDLAVTGNLSVSGNLTVSGGVTSSFSETVLFEDNILLLNSNVTGGAPSENAGIEVSRGASANVKILWNEASDVWQFTNNGSTYYNIPISGTSPAGATGSNGTTGATGAQGATGPVGNYVVSFNGLTGEVTSPTSIDSLTDVVVGSKINNDLLSWNSSTSKWINKGVGISAGNFIILGSGGTAGTGKLPAVDGSLLLEVNARYLDGKIREQITDGGVF